MAGIAGRSGRKSNYPEVLADYCTEAGLRNLQLILQDNAKTPTEKWLAAKELVLKRTTNFVDVSGVEPITRQIVLVHNYTHDDEKNRIEQCKV